MDFYYVNYITKHCGHVIGSYTGKVLLEDKPEDKHYDITWDNLREVYEEAGLVCKFNIWNCKKGRRVCFFIDGLIPHKWEKDIKEWKNPNLDITLDVIYHVRRDVSISEIMNYHDGAKALKYIEEKKKETQSFTNRKDI